MRAMRLVKHVVLGVGMLVSTGLAAQGVMLLSVREADSLVFSDEAWMNFMPPRPRGFARGPDIAIVVPIPDASEEKPITLNSPANLEIAFKPRGAPVDMESLAITAEKGFFSVSLTDRLKPYITGTRIVAKNLEIPKGRFVIVINVADQQGNATTVNYRVQVL